MLRETTRVRVQASEVRRRLSSTTGEAETSGYALAAALLIYAQSPGL